MNNQIPAGYKRCTGCGEIKPLEAFSPDKRKKSGRAARCKVCMRHYYEVKPPREGKIPNDQLPEGYKQCSKCGEVKLLEMFFQNKRYKDGYTTWCQPCHHAYYADNAEALRERQRVRYATNVEERRERQHAYRIENADAIRERRRIQRTAKAEAHKKNKPDRVIDQVPEGHKRCTQCRELKPIEMFHRQKNSYDGLHSWCKACKKKKDSKRHAEQREATRPRRRAYYLAHRDQQIASARHWNQTHQERYRVRERERNRKNPHRHAQNQRNYRARHAERIRTKDRQRNKVFTRRLQHKTAWHRRRALLKKIPGYFTARDIACIREIQQGHCCYCYRVVPLTIEHIIPITRKGTSNDPWNIALACHRCNSSKQDKLLEEWTDRWYLREDDSE